MAAVRLDLADRGEAVLSLPMVDRPLAVQVAEVRTAVHCLADCCLTTQIVRLVAALADHCSEAAPEARPSAAVPAAEFRSVAVRVDQLADRQADRQAAAGCFMVV